jgi:hypothetical protein
MKAEGLQGLGVYRNDLEAPYSQVIATCGLTCCRLNARPDLSFPSSQLTCVSRPHVADIPHKNPSLEKERHAQSDS